MYNRILVPLDGSKLAECVIPHVNLAKESKSKEVILLRVCQPASILADYPTDMPETWEEHVKAINTYSTQQCGLYLDNLEKQLKEAGMKNVRMVSKLGEAAKEITEFAEKVLRASCVPVLSIKSVVCTIS